MAQKVSEYFASIEHLKDIHNLTIALNYLYAPKTLLRATVEEYIRRLKDNDATIIQPTLSGLQ